MAISNHERVGKALELLKQGLRPFVERELKAHFGDRSAFEVKDVLTDTRLGGGKGDAMQDVAVSVGPDGPNLGGRISENAREGGTQPCQRIAGRAQSLGTSKPVLWR
jgi:hypothetical protein